MLGAGAVWPKAGQIAMLEMRVKLDIPKIIVFQNFIGFQIDNFKVIKINLKIKNKKMQGDWELWITLMIATNYYIIER